MMIPLPGTEEALTFDCTCPTAENAQRATRREDPLYSPDCPLHKHVCQAPPCDHSTDTDDEDREFYTSESPRGDGILDHRGTHPFCQHCTNPKIVCRSCGKLWIDWQQGAADSGWYYSEDDRKWICKQCRSSS